MTTCLYVWVALITRWVEHTVCYTPLHAVGVVCALVVDAAASLLLKHMCAPV